MFADDIFVLFKCTWVAKHTRCVRLMQNRMELFSTAAKGLWCLRLRPQKARLSHCRRWVYRVKHGSYYKYLEIVLDIKLSDRYSDLSNNTLVKKTER